MLVFVTGATGFVGGHAVSRLLADGHEVRCLVRDLGPASSNLRAPGIDLFQGDLSNANLLAAGMAGCEALVHLGGVNSHWERRRARYREVNVDGVRNVMTAALQSKLRVAVNIGTALAWGRTETVPFNEETPPGHEKYSDYARSKFLGDRVAWRLHRDSGLPLVSFYPGGVMGPGNSKQTALYFHTILEGKMPGLLFPDARQTCIAVDDVAAMISRALVTPEAIGRKYLGGGETLSTTDLNNLLVELAGAKLPRWRIPDFALHGASVLATKLADVTKREPMLGLARASMRHLAAGCEFDGSRAVRELGITYTPMRETIAAELASYEPRPA
jgi:nucleoside-diphosphate-sugar epimerase